MRVAILADKFPPNWGGGVTSAHYHLALALRQLGHEVKVFAFFDRAVAPDEDWIMRKGAPDWYIRLCRRVSNGVFRILSPGRPAYQMRDILQRMWGVLQLRKPLLAYAPDVAIIPDHGAPGFWLTFGPTTKRLLVAHHHPLRFLAIHGMPAFSKLDAKLAAVIERRVSASADRILCPSRYMLSIHADIAGSADRLALMPNMVFQPFVDAIKPADPRPELGMPADIPVIYVPAGGNQFKGAQLLPEIIESVARLSRSRFGLFVSGAVSGQLLERLRASVPVFAPGPIDNQTTLAYAKSCSLCLSPTLVENYSMALLEAAICGLPVFTFDVGGNSDIVRPGVNGELAKPFDCDELAGKVAHVIEDGAALRGLRKQVGIDAQARLSSDALIPRLIEILQS